MRPETIEAIELIKRFARNYRGTFAGNFIRIHPNYRNIAVRKALEMGIIEKTGTFNILGQPFYRVGEKFLFDEIKGAVK